MNDTKENETKSENEYENENILLDQAQTHYEVGIHYYHFNRILPYTSNFYACKNVTKGPNFDYNCYERSCTNNRRDISLPINCFKDALLIREYFLGRYHYDTASIYNWLGMCYNESKDYDKALLVHRTSYRIWQQLGIPNKHRELESVLRQNGISQTDAKNKYLSDITASLQHEITGDTFRTEGQYELAISQYKEALGLEKDARGSCITSGFLWRKIACILGRITDSDNVIDWNKMDRINTKWHNLPNHGLCETMYKAIQKGDEYFGNLDFHQAKDQYNWAVDIGREMELKDKLCKSK